MLSHITNFCTSCRTGALTLQHIFGTKIGDVVGVHITNHGCNWKTPYGRACEITRTLKKTKQKQLYAKPTKSKHMFSSQYAPSGIFVANHFQVGIERTRDIWCLRIWEPHRLHNWSSRLMGHTWRYRHHTLGSWCHETQKSKCGGDRRASHNKSHQY